jgi:YD repeat-containing protein
MNGEFFMRCKFSLSVVITFFIFFSIIFNPAHAATSYYYDTNGRLLQESTLTGDTIRYVYDQNGNMTSKTSGESFTEFLSTLGSEQGKNNWYYQIWDGTQYKNMAWDSVGARWKGENDWEIISKDWIHPDGNDVALKWVAPQTGSIRITGKVAKHLINLQGDGVRVKIMKNSTQIWPSSGWQSIQGNDSIGVSTDVNVNVAKGDAIYFIVNENGNLFCDATVWNPSITYIEKALSAFGSEQGKNNWYYQIWDGTQYKNMTWDSVGAKWKGEKDWDIISKDWMHPDGNDAVLKWVAPQTGSIRITGRVAKLPINLQGDGVRVKMMKNSTQIWPSTGWQSIQGNDSIGVSTDVNVNVVKGEAIYFIVNQNGSKGYDGTVWNPSITYIEKASSAFGSEQGKNNWYYQIWDGTQYKNMTWDSVGARWKGEKDWDIISKDWMHPDGNDAVLKWVAPQAGSIRITGRVAKLPINLQGDGVRVKIMRNSTQIWPSSGWQSIQGNDSIGVSTNVNVNVEKGEAIYFIVNQNVSKGFDGTVWNPSIIYTN